MNRGARSKGSPAKELSARRVKLTLASETLRIYGAVARALGMPTARLMAQVLTQAVPPMRTLAEAFETADSARDRAQSVLFEGFATMASEAQAVAGAIREAVAEHTLANQPPPVEAKRSRGDSATQRKRPARSPSTASAAPGRRRRTPGL